MMNLGTFSISLAVKDLHTSRAFYERLGFAVIDGKTEDHWLMLRHGSAFIGLFQDMFEGNIITFTAPDVRSIQRSLKGAGVSLICEADETSRGPTYITLLDPDGNQILLDQHTPDLGDDVRG